MGIFSRAKAHADRFNEYFLAAVKVYLFKGDEAAGCAALSSGVVAGSLQRASMVAYLQRLSAELQNDSSMASDSPGEFRARGLTIAKLDILASQIAAKDWSLSDCVTAKKHLQKLDREYYEAQGRADPTVFYRRYPDLFEEVIQPPTRPIPCTKCNSNIDTNWKHCGSCGAPLRLSGDPATGLFCPKCGTKVDAGRSYCGKCGAKQPVPSKHGQTQAREHVHHTHEAPVFQQRAGRQDGEHDLIQAAAERNLTAIENLLGNGAGVNVQDSHGMTALMYAALQGDTAISQLLLSKGCDPNLTNEDGATALMTASFYGDAVIVRLPLEHGANPNVQIPESGTALALATSCGHQEVVALLLAHGAILDTHAREPSAGSDPRAKQEQARRCVGCGAVIGEGLSHCYECRAKQPNPSGNSRQKGASPPGQPVIATGSKECPNCCLINPTSSMKCDCGYDFSFEGCQSSAIQFFQRQCASPWLRLLAAFIDAFLVVVCLLVVGTIAVPLGAGDIGLGLLCLLYLIAVWVYHAGMESSKRQATLGKLVLRLVVTDMVGHRISFPRATLRLMAKHVAWFPAGLGYLSFFLSQRKQGLHDMAAGTLVIQR